MTKKMKQIYEALVESLLSLPLSQNLYVFGGPEELDPSFIDLVASYIIFEYIKYAYDTNDKVYPLRHFLIEKTDDERMLQSRILKYVLKYKKEEIKKLHIKLPEGHKYSEADMRTIARRLEGYKITKMNFYEHQNIHDLEIIKVIVENRIISAKKIPNNRLIEMFDQYDSLVNSLFKRAKNDDEDLVFATIAFFNLEWRYPIEILYRISKLMERNNQQTINENDLALLCSFIRVESRFGGWYTGDSRMIKERITTFLGMFYCDLSPDFYEEMRNLIKEIFVLGIQYKELMRTEDGELYKDWFQNNTSVKDWASFLKEYNLFAIWQKKEWTNKSIKNMRYLISVLFNQKYKNPENRS